ncbi:hypothetical protein NKH36_34185, partial [Mesorhizobium sp. M1312]
WNKARQSDQHRRSCGEGLGRCRSKKPTGFAQTVLPIIASIQRSGITSLRGLAIAPEQPRRSNSAQWTLAGVECAQHFGAASFCELAFIGGNLLTSMSPSKQQSADSLLDCRAQRRIRPAARIAASS